MLQLSIAIPTYNRPKQLAATLQALFAEPLPSGVEVVILDNHSPSEVEAEVSSLPAIDLQRIRFIRHPANIGLAANLLRCFELANADWVWLLGDDDPPLPGAVRAILKALNRSTDKEILIKFNSENGGQVEAIEILRSPLEFSSKCSNAGFYSNLLFISTSVFRRREMLSRISIGYHCASSLAPHVAITVDAVSTGAEVRLEPEELVQPCQVNAEEHWNWTRLKSGFPMLAELESGSTFVEQAMPSIAASYIGRRWWRGMLKGYFSENGRSKVFWCLFYLRYGAIIGGIQGTIIVLSSLIMRFVASVPGVSSAARRCLPPVSSLGNLERS